MKKTECTISILFNLILAVVGKRGDKDDTLRLVVAIKRDVSLEDMQRRWGSNFTMYPLNNLGIAILDYKVQKGFAAFSSTLADLNGDSDVDAIEFDSKIVLDPVYDLQRINVQHSLGMADPLLPKQWGMGATRMHNVWHNVESLPKYPQVKVAVIDSGVDYNHEDLQASMWSNTAELNGIAGVDDDGNGFVDDFYGWNAVANNGFPMDDNGHGTHCAGTIGATANNGIGIRGMHSNVAIIPCKFLTADGSGTMSDAVACINYSISVNATISSNSWGGTSSYMLDRAIRRAEEAGQLFVAAAGNEGRNQNIWPSYPGAYPISNIISVASLDEKGALSWFSDRGDKTVHIAAPGSNIISTTPNNTYSSMSGTSMACPFISGIAALYSSFHPDASYRMIKEVLRRTAVPCQRRCNVIWGGRLDAASAVSYQSQHVLSKVVNEFTLLSE